MRKQLSPFGALFRGILAGAAGAGLQSLFFRATTRITPQGPEEAFSPPEPEQQGEMTTQTVARRFAEQLAARGPLSEGAKSRGANVVHYGFGALWGTVYGFTRESVPAVRRPLGVLGFSTAVWMIADNVILPYFRLSAWPWRYPLRNHGYAWLAHVPYGVGVATVYALLRRLNLTPLAIGISALLARRRLLAKVPRPLRPRAKAAVKRVAPPMRKAARLYASLARTG